MHAETHRVRLLFLSVLLSLLALMLLARPAHSAWSADPVQVQATSALCPLVGACDDGHAGAIVVWQENTATGGLLKARHLLASGDLDPAWSAAAVVSTIDVTRSALGVLTDGAGGSYVWWMESTQLWLTHVTHAGGVATGWLARGRNLGQLPTSAHRPLAVTDGSGGVYVGWLTTPIIGFPPAATIRVVHLGPAGAGAGGWPGGGRTFGFGDVANPTVVSFGLDAAPGGGLWLSWQIAEQFGFGSLLPGDLRVLRTTAAGLPASGWTASGVVLAGYDPTFINSSPGWTSFPRTSQIALANDGSDGAFVVWSQGETNAGELVFHNFLRHVDGSGALFSGWNPAGVDLGDLFANGLTDTGAQASLRAFADGHGGVFAGLPWFASEFTAVMRFTRFDAVGAVLPGGIGADQSGLEYAPRGDGGMYIAAFKPSGAAGPYEADAYILVAQSGGGASFFESKTSYSAIRYGDVGLASTGDGGAIFAWFQLIDRQGVFALRLNPAGVVTGVPPTAINGPPTLRMRFVPGIGVRALISSVPAGREELSLHDVTGRVVARTSIADAVGGDWVFPGTERLANGIYFARGVSGGVKLHARVTVVR